MTRHFTPATATFIGAAGNKLVADVFGESGDPVLLLHGGGQTRHAWSKTAAAIAGTGHVAYALDQRGHGDSDWVATGAYEFADYAADAKVVAAELARRSGTKPIAIGASLGGIASLLAEGEAERDQGANVFSALVLVDITPRVDQTGVAKVLGFMRANATSIAAVTTTPIDDTNTTRRVSSTLVSADTWRSHKGTPRAIMKANTAAAP